MVTAEQQRSFDSKIWEQAQELIRSLRTNDRRRPERFVTV